MNFTDLIVLVGLLSVISQWLFPVGFMYYRNLLSKDVYLYHLIIAGLATTILFILIVLSTLRTDLSDALNTFIGLFGVAIIFYNFIMHWVAINKSKDVIDKHRQVLYITGIGLGIIILLFISLIIASIFGETFSLYSVLEFRTDRPVAVFMLLRMIAIGFISFAIYNLTIYYIAKNLKLKNQSDFDENKYFSDSYNIKRVVFVLMAGVMISFLHFAEVDLSLTLGNDYNEIFKNTLTAFHFISSAIFIPLLFDQLKTKSTEDLSSTEVK